jgi:protein-L-isoaspartate(D-aspartate) O-methyltransferase
MSGLTAPGARRRMRTSIFQAKQMSKFKAERETMIESQIRPNAVTDTALLRAMAGTPREAFVPPSQRNLAYMDGALRVEAARDGRPARYLPSPMVFAKLAQLAAVNTTDRILDVGPATGYSTAILAKLAKQVVAVECDPGLAALAQDALAQENIGNARLVIGPLEDGAPDDGPFDVIFLNGRIGAHPEKLLTQLAPGGRLVAIMGSDTAPKAKLFTKIDSMIQDFTAFDAGAPLLPGFEAEHLFTF